MNEMAEEELEVVVNSSSGRVFLVFSTISCWFMACGHGTQIPLDAFVAPVGKVVVGSEQFEREDCWWFSVVASPAFLYSGRYVNAFDASVDDQRILVTARLLPIPRAHQVSSTRFAHVCALPEGRYQVSYQDPDGRIHNLGFVGVGLSNIAKSQRVVEMGSGE